jgi:DNA-binding IclR family transcriptional regulator
MYIRTRKKNRRKAAILGVLARASGPLTYAQVAGAVGIYPISQVARDLQRYTRFRYVRRWRAAGKYRYQITRRGRERLAFFNRSAPTVRRGAPSGAPDSGCACA